MNRIISVLALVVGLAGSSHASGDALFSKGHSTWTVTGINCSSGTAIQITISTVGFITSGVRITNQDSTYPAWFGPRANVSTKTLITDALVNRGEKLTAGGSGVWELGYDDVIQVRPTMFCIGPDAAGTAGVPISVSIFGYR